MAQQGYRGMAQVSPRVRPGGDALGVPSGTPHRRSRLAEGEMERIDQTSPRKRSSRDEGMTSEEEEDAEVEEGKSWGMVDSMRLWRHDAIMQHLYETAAFWGDKILSWTGELRDGLWLHMAERDR